MKATRAQWGIFAAALALAIALIVSFRRVPRATRQPAPQAGSVAGPEGAGHPTTVLSGFDYAQTSAGKAKFQVHADRTVGFAQGAGLPSTWYGLESVALTLFNDEGSPFRVRSDRADYDPRTKAMHLKGNVVMTENSGTELRTASVDYDPALDLLHVPGSVEMFRAGIHGHAASAEYDAQKKELFLAGPVTAEATVAPFSTVRSDRAIYRRAAGEIELVGHVAGTRGSDRFSSRSLRLHLTAANRIDRASAEGLVKGSVTGTPGQPPERFSGERAALKFGTDGGLDFVRLTGAPSIVESAEAAPGAGSRRLAAPALTLDYEAGRLRRAKAGKGAQMERDLRGPKGEAVHETIRSDSAEASFADDGTIHEAKFEGNVVATSPDAIARAPEATFAAAENRMSFLAAGDRDAEVSAPRGIVVARRIDMFSGASRLTATGSARAFLRPSAENGSLPGFLSSSKKPTRAKADRIELDDTARTATFSGDAAIWQEADALFADTIRLFDRDRTAAADRNVRAVSRSAGAAGGKSPALTTITAESMRYQEASRTARFEHHVVATRGTRAAKGEAAESRFNARNQIEQTILTGGVSFSDSATGRRGSGDRAEDDPLAGVTTLFGDPAVAHDAQGNRITAAILTFRKDSGTVEARAKDGKKIESIYQTGAPSHGHARGRMN